MTDGAAAAGAGGFAPFSPAHAVVAACCVAGWCWLVLLARRTRGGVAERRFRVVIASFTAVWNGGWSVYRLLPARFDVDDSIPLHACDFAWILGALAILRPGGNERPLRQLAFFWGIGLAPLGVLTPVVTDGPESIEFWAFWLRHFLIPACALVDVFAYGLRPTRRGLGLAIGFGALLLAPVTLLNVALDTNYLFTGREIPSTPTPLDLLGPWPLRILWIALLGAAWFAALLFAFTRGPAGGASPRADRAAP